MRAMDVMTTEVISVSPEVSVQELAKVLSDRGISGVPVIDADSRLVGVVTEGDLLHRAETGTAHRGGHPRARWLDTLAADRELARDYIKSHARKVADIMTRDVVSVDETADLADIANLLEARRIKRVPVVRDGRVVGIVSRANLVRAVAAAPGAAGDGEDDRTIRARLLAELRAQQWAKVWAADVIVRDKVVHFWIADDHPGEEREALRIAAENIAGVRAVEAHIVPAPEFPLL